MSSKDLVASWLGIKRRKFGVQDLNPTDLFEPSLERETLVSLIAAVDTIAKRKSHILHAIARFNGCLSQLRNKKDFTKSDIGRSFAWLIANLQTTNHALRKALRYLQMLYGKAISKK